jgi:hypothetical protein
MDGVVFNAASANPTHKLSPLLSLIRVPYSRSSPEFYSTTSAVVHVCKVPREKSVPVIVHQVCDTHFVIPMGPVQKLALDMG